MVVVGKEVGGKRLGSSDAGAVAVVKGLMLAVV